MNSRLRFKYLENRYKDRIFSYALWMVKNRDDAKDITQEILIKIWEHGHEIKLSSIKSWIMRATHNLCIDYFRKRSVKFKYEQKFDVEDALYGLPDPGKMSDPGVETEQVIINEELEEAINKLPDLQKKIIIMYEIQELKYREISEILDIPINSVKVNIFRARKSLQKLLQHYKHS
jgi:RNA polymerase sigma factor (sigma-70 family)